MLPTAVRSRSSATRLRAIQRINPECFEELVKAGMVTADRVSGLKIGYRKGNKLAGLLRPRRLARALRHHRSGARGRSARDGRGRPLR